MWSAEVDASLYSTPRLFDLNGDGVKEVISQVHALPTETHWQS
jgi:hypothetical protein